MCKIWCEGFTHILKLGEFLLSFHVKQEKTLENGPYVGPKHAYKRDMREMEMRKSLLLTSESRR